MPTIRISETYDLSTQPDKMGIIGVHTPTMDTVKSLYPGLFENYKYFTLDGCDITLVCASVLPADPSQIGTEAGDIAPQDMLNPILYKAVSNESFDMFNARLNTLTGMMLSSLDKDDQAFYNSNYTDYDDWDTYYGLLSEPHGFLKAMPQNGLSMTGLYPMVFPLLTVAGNVYTGTSNTTSYTTRDVLVTKTGEISFQNSGWMKGPGQRMPRLPTHIPFYPGNVNDADGELPSTIVEYPPKTFVGMIITPPAKLHKLYYRMRISWTITFHELTPVTMFDLGTLNQVGASDYQSDFNFASAKTSLAESTNMVDATNTDVELIMTSGK